jgi:hypothetical protein
MHVSPFFSLVTSGSRAEVATFHGLLAKPAAGRCFSIPPSIKHDDRRI